MTFHSKAFMTRNVEISPENNSSQKPHSKYYHANGKHVYALWIFNMKHNGTVVKEKTQKKTQRNFTCKVQFVTF